MAPFRRFHSIAALGGDGLRPELQALFERLAVDPHWLGLLPQAVVCFAESREGTP